MAIIYLVMDGVGRNGYPLCGFSEKKDAEKWRDTRFQKGANNLIEIEFNPPVAQEIVKFWFTTRGKTKRLTYTDVTRISTSLNYDYEYNDSELTLGLPATNKEEARKIAKQIISLIPSKKWGNPNFLKDTCVMTEFSNYVARKNMENL